MKNKILPILCFLSLLGALACSSLGGGKKVESDPRIEEDAQLVNSVAADVLIQQAQQFIEADQLDKAEWKLMESIRLAPTYGPAYYWMAVVKMKQNELSQAKAYLQKAHLRLGGSPKWAPRLERLADTIDS